MLSTIAKVKCMASEDMMTLLYLLVFYSSALGVNAQSCIPGDGCDPPMPCNPGDEMGYPPDCTTFLVCISPYDWRPDPQHLCSSKGLYNNVTCACDSSSTCVDRPCPIVTGPTEAPIASIPCAPDPINCPQYPEGDTVSDMIHCSSYFRCLSDLWVKENCPPDDNYYDHRNQGQPQPCGNNPNVCGDNIDCSYTLPSVSTTAAMTTDLTTDAISTLDFGTTDGAPISCITERDGCDPPLLCTPGDQMAYPPDCTTFLVCTSLFEWIINPGNLCANKGPYNNQTCECDLSAECEERPCPPTQTDPILPSLPCAPNRTHCQQFPEGATVADRTHCTNYFRCVSDVWVMEDCPPEESYYDERLAGDPLPCVNNPSVCQDNNQCIYFTTPPTTPN